MPAYGPFRGLPVRHICTARPMPAGVGGYSILKPADMDRALAVMDGHPHLIPGVSIHNYWAPEIPGRQPSPERASCRPLGPRAARGPLPA